jgi:hypothetical protein
MATYYVNPRPPNGNPDEWCVKKRGGMQASSVCGSKAKALSTARKMGDDGDTLVIKDANGNVMRRNTISKAQQKAARKGMRRSMGSSPFDNY